MQADVGIIDFPLILQEQCSSRGVENVGHVTRQLVEKLEHIFRNKHLLSQRVQAFDLSATRVCFCSSASRSFRELTADDSSYEKRGEGNPVLWVRDGKGEEWRQKKEVVEQRGEQRHEDCLPKSPPRRDNQNSQQKYESDGCRIMVKEPVAEPSDEYIQRRHGKVTHSLLGGRFHSEIVVDSTFACAQARICPMTKTPEQWLEEAAPEKKEAIFKLFLGYAPGVGKTYNMLSEGIRRASRGEDIVIGLVETHGRKGVAELAARLEHLPRRSLNYKGAAFEEMDVDAIVARKPQVALIDELAHTNVEGSKHRKRYDDVLEILKAGIDVLSTVNVQHVESLTPLVQQITGVPVRETIPDWVMQRVNEIVLVDLTPEALQTRMRRGDIYPTDRVERALGNFFRPANLLSLRELALEQVTRAVDRSLESYLEKEGAEQPTVRESIAVCTSSNPAAQYLIARAARMAQRINADLYVIYVDIGVDETPENQRSLAQNLRFAESLGAKAIRAKGKNVAEEVAKVVREWHITQVVFGRSAQSGWRRYLYLSAIHKFLRDAPNIDVHIVTQEVK